MTGKIVLSTPLLVAYENVAFNYGQYQKKYKRLMKVISLPYKTNKAQLMEAKAQNLNASVYERLLPQLQHQPDREATLEKLASNTILKIILTDDEDATLPYVYYRSSFMSNQVTISLTPNDSRNNLVKYLQILCSSATKVTICDNYLAEGWAYTENLFKEVLPLHELDIQFVETPNNVSEKTENLVKNSDRITDAFLKPICNQWQVSQSKQYANLHDRYLLIESRQGKVEVMISSGFVHIWKPRPKELTCLIREVGIDQ